MKSTIPAFGFAFACLALVTCIGCGSGQTRYPIAGTATLDGEPIANANVLFTPRSEGQPPVSVRLVDGRFELTELEGLPEGAYDVTVIPATPEFEEISVPGPTSVPAALVSTRVPQQYQRPGALEAKVVAGTPNEFEFLLISRSN